MELGDEPEVKTAAKLAQMMAYQNKNLLQARPPPACVRVCSSRRNASRGLSSLFLQLLSVMCSALDSFSPQAGMHAWQALVSAQAPRVGSCTPPPHWLRPPPPPPGHLQAGLIVAGWDKHEGGSVYAIPLGGTLVKTPFTIGGSGSAYIYGLCDKLWRVRAAPVRAGVCVLPTEPPGINGPIS